MPKGNPNKCSAEECFIAARNMTNELNHKVVKDPNRKAKSLMSLSMYYRMTAGWIPQETDNINITKAGDPWKHDAHAVQRQETCISCFHCMKNFTS